MIGVLHFQRSAFERGIGQLLGAARRALPRGGSLPENVWRRRHRVVLGLLWLHAIGIAWFGLLMGYGLAHSLAEGAVVGVIAAVAGLLKAGRRARAAIASLGLVTCSAMLVHLSGGYIEVHFHFFVMVAVITLYQDWIPFLLAIGYVVVEHGLGGMLIPTAVYNHPDAIENPWKWALIHGVFVLAESLACIAAWRLNESDRARTELILNSAGEGICGLDAGGRIAFANPAAATMSGYEVQDLVGRRVESLLQPSGIVVLADRSGTSPIDALLSSCEGGKVTEQSLRRKDGTTLPIEYLITPIREHGELVGAVVAFRDITERKQAEDALREHAEQLERANRELQDFAYVASHDLQEPLRKVQAFADRVVAKYAEALDDNGRDYLARMQGAAGRMQTMINDLLALSRVTTQAQPAAAVDLACVAREVVSDLETRLEQTEGRVELDELPVIEANPLQMRQLLQNLIGNALKFRREDEPPVVRVEARSVSPEEVEITVRDNGIGFDEKYLDRIFGPFQRLHGRGTYEGTGIGLAICRKIAERHGGSITARSAPGEGATFIVTLPLIRQDTPHGVAA